MGLKLSCLTCDWLAEVLFIHLNSRSDVLTVLRVDCHNYLGTLLETQFKRKLILLLLKCPQVEMKIYPENNVG
jgi:hypothetical protein